MLNLKIHSLKSKIRAKLKNAFFTQKKSHLALAYSQYKKNFSLLTKIFSRQQ